MLNTSLRKILNSNLLLFILLAICILFGLAWLYHPALNFPLTNGDDLVILSKVANTTNPGEFFFTDWGLGNNAYRPLHSLSIWIMYKLVGVWAYPNQLTNLVLHILNTLLIYYILWKDNVPIWISFGVALLFGTSMYSMSPATWISDRPNLMVAILLNLNLVLIFRHIRSPHIAIVAVSTFISILGLLCKESGLVIPLLIIVLAIALNLKYRKPLIISSGIVLLLYFAFRFVVFSSQAYSYSESGYLLGVIAYPDNTQFSFFLQILVFLDNVLKNIVANILMIFGPEGGFQPWAELQSRLSMVLSIFLLSVMAFLCRKKNPLYVAALFILIINALIHFQLFRYRALYLGFEALLLFVGSGFSGFRWINKNWVGWVLSSLLFVALLSNVSYSVDHLENQTFKKNREINRYELQTVVTQRGDHISPEIIEEVLELYKRK